MESGNYSSDGAYLVSPKFEDLGTDKKIKFSLSYNTTNSNYPQQLAVGTITNPCDPGTFHLLQKVSATPTATQKTIYLNNYNGVDKYIAYKAVETSGHFILDDFSYEQSVNCVDIANVNFTNITENSAQLNFTGLNQTSWELYIKNLRTQQDQTIIINQNPYIIQNLIGNTNYEIKLRAICDVNLYSNWTSLANFSTVCNSISAGYYISFEETYYPNPCWTQYKSNTSTIRIPNSLPFNFSVQTGTRAIEITAGYLDTTLSFVTPMISDISTNKRIRFSMIAGGDVFNDSNLLVGTMTDPTNPSTFTLLKTISFNEINDLKNTFVNCSWKEYIINLDNYIGNGNYIALKHSNTNSINDTFFIDDFYYENQPVCSQPINPTSTNAKFNEIKLNWLQMPNVLASEFEIEYGATGFVQGAGTLVNTTSSPLIINNLPFDDTIYDYYIRSKCGLEYSNWTKKQTFKTKCAGVTAVFTTNFTNIAIPNLDNLGCWSRTTPYLPEVGYDATDFVWAYSTQGVANSACVILYNQQPNQTNSMDKTILITPRLIDFNNYKKIKFKLKKNNPGLITIGTLSSDNDYATFSPYKNIIIDQPNSGVWTTY